MSKQQVLEVKKLKNLELWLELAARRIEELEVGRVKSVKADEASRQVLDRLKRVSARRVD